MCTSKPKTPKAVTIPTPVAAAPVPVAPAAQVSDPTVVAAQDDERTRRLRAASGNNTLVTGGAGLTTPASTGTKQLFGQ